MFVWRNLIAVALLLVGMSAHADEPKIYGSLEGIQKFQIKVLPAKECERLITDTLYSTAAIEEGVKALAEIENPSAHARECLGTALDTWPDNFPTPDYIAIPEEPPVSRLYELKVAKARLQQQRTCAGKTVSSSCPNPPSPDEYQNLSKQVVAADVQIERFEQILSTLSGFVLPSPPIDDSHYKQLAAQTTGCKKVPAESQPMWKCGESLVTDKQHTHLEEQASAAQQEWFNRELEYSRRKQAVQNELDHLLVAQPELGKKALAVLETVKCVNPHDPHSLAAEAYSYDSDCTESAKLADRDSAIQQVQAVLGSTPGFLAAMDQRVAAEKARNARRIFEKNSARNFNYGLEALLARYDFFLHHGGKPETLASFCADNERAQQRDHDFALIGEKMFAPVLSYAEDDRYLELARKFGLTEGELWAVNRFTSKFFAQINPALIAGSLSPELAAYKELLDAALAKLPAYQGGPLKRFVSLPQAVLQEHQPGQVVCYKSFSSTSKKADWKWDGKQEMVLYPGEHGKDISGISALPDEQEVLFAANSCFKVLSVNGDASKLVLGEVDKNGHVIAKIPSQEQP